MATRFQVKRSTVSGVVPTTGDIANGELAVNLADRKLFTSNGSAVLELGSNLTNLSVTGNVTVRGIIANGSLGTSGQVLHSNGTSTYWAADDAGVTSVATGNGLTGGTITTTGTISVIANSGLSANATGVYVVPGNGLVAANSTGVHVGAGSGITVNSTAVSVLANSGLSANATGIYVVPGNGLIAANSTGVHVGAGSGITVNSTAVGVLANSGITANATGTYVTQGTGTVVNATGVHVNSSYIGTLTANNATNLNGQPASYYTNATNITTGTLATARLPATANITTAVNVGANVNLSTTRISVGNSTVNVVINSTAISVTSDPLIQQSDIGTDPNQIPLNQYLGTLAYQSDTIAVSNVFAIGSAGYFAANGNVGIGTNGPSKKLTVNGDVTATSLYITGSGDYITPTTGVDGWYFADSFSVSGQDTEPRDLYFSSDGTKMYVLGNAGDDVNEYSLSTPWAVNTATFTTNFVVSAQETTPLGLTFKPDGTAMYIVGSTNDAVYQYTLSTPWSIATASYASKSFSVGTQDTAPQAIEFSSDGTKMYIVGDTDNDVNEYTLSTAWDVTTASFVTSFSVAAYETAPQGIAFNSAGTKMFIVGSTFARLVEYNLATPWSIATATFSNFSVISNLGTYLTLGISGVYYSEAQGKAYISDYQNDRIFQLTTNVASTKMVGTKFVFQPDVLMQQDLVVDRNGRFNGELRSIGTMSAGGFSTSGTSTLAGAVTLSTTTGAISIGTSQTTGTLTAGGTAGTGAIQIGRSTATQSIAIANGATTSGETKTIEIGTAGLAGSITNITVGSTTGTVTTVINGNVGIGNSAPAHKLRVDGDISLSGGIHANGALGTSGQILTSNGSGVYWSSPGVSSINTAAQFTWTNTHTFQANVTFTGSQNFADNELARPLLKDYAETVSSPSISSGSLTLDLENGNIFTVTLNASVTTLTISNPPASGRAGSFTLILTADGTARTITWPAAVKWAGGTPPTLTSTNGKVDILTFFTTNGGTTWFGVVSGQNF